MTDSLNFNQKKKLVEENGNSWRDYKMYLLNSIEFANEELKNARKERTELKIEIAKLQEKSRNWGAMAGAASAFVISLITYFVTNGIK